MEELKLIVKKEYIENDESLCFETTPIYKIVILSIITFGIYEFILLFRYWQTLRTNFGYKINSFLRGVLFGIYFNFDLFPILSKYTGAFKIKLSHPILLALIYFVFIITDNVLFKINLSYPEIEKQHSLLFTALDIITYFSFLVLVAIQTRINQVNLQYFPNAKINKWSLANTLWAIPCTLLFLLIILSYFLPE